MKRLLFASLTTVAFAVGPALAADISGPAPAPIYPKAMPAPVQNWTGLYLGGGGGYGMWNADTTVLSAAGAPLTAKQTQGGRGYFGTVSVGFDYQFTDHIVAGLLADYDFASLKGTVQDQVSLSAGDMTEQSAWAAGARIGWLITPDVFTYFNGGYTQARFNSVNLTSSVAGPAFGTLQSTLAAHTFTGYFLGSGLETTVPILGNGWFSRTEYRLSQFDSANIQEVLPAGGLGNMISVHPYVQTVRSELLYKFNWGRY